MSRRTPLSKARVSGRTTVNPRRFVNRTEIPDAQDLGEAYECMPEAMREAWDVFRAELPWLRRHHRALVQIACTLRARIDAGSDPGVGTLRVYSSVLSKLGATPADAGKVVLSEEDDDPAEKFFAQ